jgi:hypothetical protein
VVSELVKVLTHSACKSDLFNAIKDFVAALATPSPERSSSIVALTESYHHASEARARANSVHRTGAPAEPNEVVRPESDGFARIGIHDSACSRQNVRPRRLQLQWRRILGSRGLGEVGIVGTVAAIADAVYHAMGTRVRDLPLTPDKVLAPSPLGV